ncbi:3TM-type holin [Shewanella halifaxensis]|uniref:3TM-type holin n=1 Tax=Shewanella halifaxensis TaxID=271098 RepID=UPI000D599360|nr:3TM-type holin [Shewanella halifaxensis]
MSWFLGTNPIEAIGKAGDALFTSDEERKQLDNDLTEIKQRPMLMQALANTMAAQHRSAFVAGARPFLMWVCGFGFLFAFLVNPILQWIWPDVGTPELPLEVMMELTLAMLGLAGLRTVEKIKGVAK